MSLIQELQNRSDKKCELCGATSSLEVYEVKPVSTGGVDGSIFACSACVSQIEEDTNIEVNHWHCLNDSMWSPYTPVKVVVWRMLHRLKPEGWSRDLLDMMYMEEEELRFAQASGDHLEDTDKVIHRDVNGVVLKSGDSVILIKDLKVKGSSMVAKQGTVVRRIALDHENDKFIEGRVGPTQIVIVTDYVKKMAEKE
ncbi:alkylphosphonate utilization protein [Tenacibaculum sp. SG-28]|uniref:PhnA domain-containing protein n=1 Tax=Tenacibaculum sp. SG-28 TaxID=754426 RepID=UPI000CF54153|nr:alkylphosphonate utilization protein [Tenacibaculum sp. SG-28]PQJ21626.1 PhnA protein [Tenacibaculum sp. SG-28]